MKLGGKNDNKLCVITAYRIVQEKGTQPISENYNVSYWQQVKTFNNSGTVDPDPRNQVLEDLTTFIDDQKSKGYEVILMMDASESAKAKNSKITQFMERNSLHDVHKTIMRWILIMTRLGSRSRINFMFATEGILQMVWGIGYHALHTGINSDHIMLWTAFNFKKFFDGSHTSPSSP